MKQRILYKCNYCKHSWLSRFNPKKCPKCHNPVNKKPMINMRYING